LNFLTKPWQETPKYTYEERSEKSKRQAETKYALTQYQLLLEQEKLLKVPSYKDAGAKETVSTSSPVFNLKGAASQSGLNFSAKDLKK
jgi:hypothetical protein